MWSAPPIEPRTWGNPWPHTWPPAHTHYQVLSEAPPGFPSRPLKGLTCPFSLDVTEREGYTLGGPRSPAENSFAPWHTCQKLSDLTNQGWAPRICALAASELLVCEPPKVTFGSPTTILSFHNLSYILLYKGWQTLPPSQVLSLQVPLAEDATLTF